MDPNADTEDWLKVPNGQATMWPHFEKFLNTQAQAYMERERLDLTSARPQIKDREAARTCRKCTNKQHQKKKDGEPS